MHTAASAPSSITAELLCIAILTWYQLPLLYQLPSHEQLPPVQPPLEKEPQPPWCQDPSQHCRPPKNTKWRNCLPLREQPRQLEPNSLRLEEGSVGT